MNARAFCSCDRHEWAMNRRTARHAQQLPVDYRSLQRFQFELVKERLTTIGLCLSFVFWGVYLSFQKPDPFSLLFRGASSENQFSNAFFEAECEFPSVGGIGTLYA